MKLLSVLAIASSSILLACNSPILEHVTAQTIDRGNETITSGCSLSFPNHGLCVSVEWDNPPDDQSPAAFTLRFWNPQTATENGPYISPNETVYAKLWMPSMGHGSAPITLTPATDAGGMIIPGIYQGSNVNFIMPGLWQLKIQLKQGAIVTEEAILNVQI